MTDPGPHRVAPSGPLPWFILVCRVALGVVFLFAAYTKLSDPLLFAQAIEKFKMTTPGDHDHLVKIAAFAVPWIEALAAAALMVGLRTRAAALVLVAMLAFFMYAIYGVLARGESFECSCFGRLSLLCPKKLGWCNIAQNAALIALGLVPLAAGGGQFSLDRAFAGRRA
jgi:uncharacterized membrane protein YphA (DoxX/SURF4 family)